MEDPSPQPAVPEPVAAESSAPESAVRGMDPRLLAAVISVAQGLDLTETLQRIVGAARDLTSARYGALSAVGPDGRHTTFVHSGMDEAAVNMIGHPPVGAGLLGRLVDLGVVIRSTDVTAEPTAVGFPAGHPTMTYFLGVPLRSPVSDRILGNLYLGDTEHALSAQDEQLVLSLADAAAAAIENANRYEDSQRTSRWLSAASEVTQALLAGQDEEEALRLIAARSVNVVGAHASALVLEGLAGDWVLEIAHGDPLLDRLIGVSMPPGGRTRQVMETGKGLRVNDFAAEQNVLIEELRAFGPALYAPLIDREGAIGVLILLRRAGSDPFEVADLAAAEDFGRAAALTVHLGEARMRQAEAEMVAERARIARDLHDLVVQELFAVGISLNRLREQVPETTGRELEASIDVLDRAVREIRTTIRALREPGEPVSIIHRLVQEVNAAATMLGFAPRVDTSGLTGDSLDDLLTAEQGDDVVAVVREALSNAARHARARDVVVRLTQDLSPQRAELVLEVSDDGVGLPEQSGRRSGLINLGERARRHHGRFEALQHGVDAGRGTTLRWVIPLATLPEASPDDHRSPGTA